MRSRIGPCCGPSSRVTTCAGTAPGRWWWSMTGRSRGRRGALVDCCCVELSTPPGFVECHECAALIRVPGRAAAARHRALLREYLDFCVRSGSEPAYCLRCGEYLPLANGV